MAPASHQAIAAKTTADGFDRQAGTATRPIEAKVTAISIPGQFGRSRRSRKIRARRAYANDDAPPSSWSAGACAEHCELGQQRPGFGGGQLQPAEIPELAGDIVTAMPAGEADRHRMRDVAGSTRRAAARQSASA